MFMKTITNVLMVQVLSVLASNFSCAKTDTLCPLDVDQFIVHCSAYLLQTTWLTSTRYNEISLGSKSSAMDFMKLFACHYQEEKNTDIFIVVLS